MRTVPWRADLIEPLEEGCDFGRTQPPPGSQALVAGQGGQHLFTRIGWMPGADIMEQGQDKVADIGAAQGRRDGSHGDAACSE